MPFWIMSFKLCVLFVLDSKSLWSGFASKFENDLTSCKSSVLGFTILSICSKTVSFSSCDFVVVFSLVSFSLSFFFFDFFFCFFVFISINVVSISVFAQLLIGLIESWEISTGIGGKSALGVLFSIVAFRSWISVKSLTIVIFAAVSSVNAFTDTSLWNCSGLIFVLILACRDLSFCTKT